MGEKARAPYVKSAQGDKDRYNKEHAEYTILKEGHEKQLTILAARDANARRARGLDDDVTDESRDGGKEKEKLFNKIVTCDGREGIYFYVLTYIPDLRWCRLAPMHKKLVEEESSPARGGRKVAEKVAGSPRSAKKLREAKLKETKKSLAHQSSPRSPRASKARLKKAKEKKTPISKPPKGKEKGTPGGGLAHLHPRWVLVPEDDGGIEIDVSAERCQIVKGRALRNCAVSVRGSVWQRVGERVGERVCGSVWCV
jgi:hypothetical protein